MFKTKKEEAIMLKKKSLSFLLGFFIIACLLVSQQLFAQSQETAVPVEQEPRHRTVFQNKYVRIYDCLVPPGDITLFHTHSFDNVAVTVSGGKLRNEIPGEAPTERVPPTGNIAFAKGTNAPYTHRIINIGETPLRFVVPEIQASAPSPGTPAALDAVPGHKLVLENDRVKVYRVSIDPKQVTGIRSRTLPWVRISISQSTISIHEPGKTPEILETKPGDYRWHEGGTTDSLENIGSTRYEAAEIEWK
jgi:quercetin dioxygenase-like cupin family protein